MSRYVPQSTSLKNLRRDWINNLVQTHNLICECLTPLEHTIEEIFQQEPDIKKLYTQKCPGSTTTGTEDVAELGDGDLDRLFAEDFGEKEDAATVDG